MLKRNVPFNERIWNPYTMTIPGVDSSHTENSKDKPISMGHLNSPVQSFLTGLWDPTGGPPNCLHVFHATLKTVKLLKWKRF